MAGLQETLVRRPYPGRGVLAARTGSGRRALAYFLTGRTAASRERRLVLDGRGNVLVQPVAAPATDALRHYAAVVVRGEWFVAGNGDHVSPIASTLAAGKPMSVVALVYATGSSTP